MVVVGELQAQTDLFERYVLGAELEGFIAKRADSTYQPGVVSRDWL
jgi:ATP-dependent DNA ligase